MRQPPTVDAALALFPLGLIACVFIWQSGRTERRRLAIDWQRERYIADQHAASKRWAEEKAETLAKFDTLKDSVDQLTARTLRLENGRVLQERQRVG